MYGLNLERRILDRILYEVALLHTAMCWGEYRLGFGLDVRIIDTLFTELGTTGNTAL
jgi:hypothetical protein